MAGPLDGLDLGPPSPTKKQQPPAATPTTNTSGPLAGVDLSASAPAAPAAPEVPWFSMTGNDKIGEFVAKMGDAATMGLAAKAQDALGVAQGPHGETVAQQVENAGKDIGPIASGVADVAGYGVGGGALGVGEGIGALATSGIAKGIGENIASRVAGRAIGAGVEGAGSTIVGAAGHDENLTAGDLLKSTLLSAGTGALTPNLSAGSKAKVPSPTADLDAAVAPAFAPLKSKVYQTPDVEKAISNVSVPQGMQANMSEKLSTQIDRIKGIVAQGGQTTANDIAGFRRSLIAASTNDTDSTIAGKYIAALDKGVGPNTAADIAAANKVSNVAKTSGEIDDWITQAQRNPGKVPDAVNNALTNNPQFYQGGVGDKLWDVANSKPGLMSKVGGKVGYGLANAAIDAAGNYIAGGNPIVGAVTGGLGGTLLGHGSDQLRSGNLVNKLAAARHFNATGESLPASAFSKGIPVLGPLSTYAPKVPAALGASGWWGSPASLP